MDEQIRIVLALKNELKYKDKLNAMFSGIDGVNCFFFFFCIGLFSLVFKNVVWIVESAIILRLCK